MLWTLLTLTKCLAFVNIPLHYHQCEKSNQETHHVAIKFTLIKLLLKVFFITSQEWIEKQKVEEHCCHNHDNVFVVVFARFLHLYLWEQILDIWILYKCSFQARNFVLTIFLIFLITFFIIIFPPFLLIILLPFHTISFRLLLFQLYFRSVVIRLIRPYINH